MVDSSNNIIHSGGGYAENTLTMTQAMNIPDGDYTLKFFDTFSDGFCCGFGNGNYELKYSYGEVIISGTGLFADSIFLPMTLGDASYRFLGESETGSPTDCYNKANWNKLSYPIDCYWDDNDIIIEADCVVDSMIFSQQRNLIIKNGAKLEIKD